jgi:DNA-binding NarL/FixJ family response regulator
MENSPVRILLVEDFEPFRNLIRILLEGKPHLQIIAEVADGQEAVRQAAELKPALILLDIGLPSLNGLDVARQVRELSPDSKILFVTQESSPEFGQETLSLGASGFVTKTRVANDLVLAIEAVLSGGTFVSASPDQDTLP